MTREEETLDIIDKAIKKGVSDVPLWETIRDAVEKQIPQVPRTTSRGGVFWDVECPRCHKITTTVAPRNLHHCACGQALKTEESSQ